MVYSNIAASMLCESTTADPVQFSIDINRSSLSLFEAVIECDFAEVYSEHGLISLTEADSKNMAGTAKQGIFSKIKEFFKKIKEFIKKWFNLLMEKITGILKTDKKIWEKYHKYFDIAKAKKTNCDIEGYNTVNFDKLDTLLAYDIFKELEIEKYFKMVEDNMGQNDVMVNSCVNQFKKNCQKVIEIIEDMSKDIVVENKNKRLVNIISSSDQNNIMYLTSKGMKNIIGIVKANCGAEQKTLDKLEKQVDMSTKLSSSTSYNFKDIENNKLKQDREVAIVNARYEIISEAQKVLNKYKSCITFTIKTVYQACRKIFIGISTWNMKNKDNSDTSSTKNENYYWALGEVSDQFVSECFEVGV